MILYSPAGQTPAARRLLWRMVRRGLQRGAVITVVMATGTRTLLPYGDKVVRMLVGRLPRAPRACSGPEKVDPYGSPE